MSGGDVNVNGKLNIIDIDDPILISDVMGKYSTDCFDTVFIYSPPRNCAGELHHAPGDTSCNYWFTDPSMSASYGGYESSVVSVPCVSGSGGDDTVGGVITTPIGGGSTDIDLELPPDPCVSLKKVNLKVKTSLRNLSVYAATAEYGEYGNSFQVDSSNTMTLPVNLEYSPSNSINIPNGSYIYGGAHTHPLTGYYMFSFSDVITLLNLYNQANTTIKKDVVFILVNPDGSSYAIKIIDTDAFYANIQQKFNATGIYGPDMQRKVTRADSQLEDKYIGTSIPTDSDKLARTFLEHFNGGSGMYLYKSTGNFDGWKKLSLPTNPSSPSLTETPCN